MVAFKQNNKIAPTKPLMKLIMTYNQKGSQEPCSPMALSGLPYKEDWVGSHPPTPICYN